MIRFSHTIFYVADVMEAIKFYERAFDLKPRFIHESGSYAELSTEGVTLAFAQDELGNMNLPSGFQKNSLQNLPQACEIAFTTDNVDALYEKAQKAGAVSVAPPQMKPWGQKAAYIRDPAGVLIEISGEM